MKMAYNTRQIFCRLAIQGGSETSNSMSKTRKLAWLQDQWRGTRSESEQLRRENGQLPQQR